MRIHKQPISRYIKYNIRYEGNYLTFVSLITSRQIALCAKFRLFLFPLQPCPDLIDAPYHGHDEDGHGRHQPKEGHGVVEVILPRVVAEDGENDERHLVHQMVGDGESLHA